MFDHSIAFDQPYYLLLLLLIPPMWWWGFQSLAGLGRWRRLIALTLRSLVVAIIVFALADVQYQRRSDQLTVVYVLDQSLSIPVEQRQEMMQYVRNSIDQHRSDARRDRYAVIVFGRDAEVEIPLIDVNVVRDQVESVLDPEYTDLATAIQRAKAIFPYDAAKRIVLVTDGNQNLGNAYREARGATATGVSIDVVPVYLSSRSEVSVEKVDVPSGVRKDQPFEIRVVLDNDAEEGSGATVGGRLQISRKAGDLVDTIADEHIEVEPGKKVLMIPEKIERPAFYTYEARFIADDPADDGMVQNNVASAFTHIQGRGNVLLIENFDKRGEFDYMVDRLRAEGIEVTVRATDDLFTSVVELQDYDCVILANVSRSSGDDADSISSFSDAQIEALVQNTNDLGCGLIMIGGPDTYGVGGWSGTKLEEAMPVEFQIKSAKVTPVGALCLMMHAGEMPKSNYWQKRIAIESIKLLGNRDYCGLVQWNGQDQWLWGASKGGMIRVGPSRRMMMAQVDRMQIGDMPAFDGALGMAARAFAGLPDAAVKHMIIISDGDPTPPKGSTIQALKQQGVKVTTVAVPSHGGIGNQLGNTMQDIATQTGGKYYVVRNANALPKIYQREARRVARPLVYEPNPPVSPQLVRPDHEIVRGLDVSALPPISGFVLTTVKDNPLVEVIARSPLPATERNSTVLAAWTYGNGKAVALTTDAGARWASSWTGWDGYDTFFSQMVRWAMRPTGDTGNYSVSTNVRDGKTQVVVTALDENEEFLNDQLMSATVIGPDMTSLPIRIDQSAPGRYVGEFDSQQAGSYLIVVNPGAGGTPIRTGVNVGYSAEYNTSETNSSLLKSLADLRAGDEHQPTGVWVENGLESVSQSDAIEQNPFRRDLPRAVAPQSIWPWLIVVATCLFWGDVFVRRVQVNFEWLLPILARARDFVLRRDRPVAVPETMSRLRSRKQEIGQQIESQKASARFQARDEELADAPPPPLATSAPDAPGPAKPEPSSTPADAPEQESYTERLLKAKKQVWREKQGDDQ